MRYICAIDPGCEESAYVLLGPDLRPESFTKQSNEIMYLHMIEALNNLTPYDDVVFAVEMIASYGMPVGREVFDTVLWIGRLQERLRNYDLFLIYRKDEKAAICHSPKANDATIRQALIDRFAPGVPNKGKGSKKCPGWFYGFRADIWQAYAVGVTYHDIYEVKGE